MKMFVLITIRNFIMKKTYVKHNGAYAESVETARSVQITRKHFFYFFFLMHKDDNRKALVLVSCGPLTKSLL